MRAKVINLLFTFDAMEMEKECVARAWRSSSVTMCSTWNQSGVNALHIHFPHTPTCARETGWRGFENFMHECSFPPN